MAVRFDGSTDALSRTAAGLESTALTMCGWGCIDVDRNAFSTFFGADDAGTGYFLVNTLADGTTHHFDGTGGVEGTGSALTVGAWYFLAYTYTPGAGNDTLYSAAPTAATMTANNSGAAAGVAASTWTFRIGNNGFSEFLNGRVHNVKIYTATLTAAELEQERWSFHPRRTTNLWAWYPLDGNNTADYSGNGRTLTSAGTPVDAHGPPLGYGAPIIVVHAAGSAALSAAVDTADLVLAGVDVTAAGSGTTTAAVDVATLTLAGQTPGATGSGTATVAVDVADLTLTGVTPAVAGSGTATASVDVAALTLTGVDVAAAAGTVTTAIDSAALVLTGIDVSASGSGTATVTVDVAALALTGVDVVAVTGITVAIDTAILTLTGVEVPATGSGTAAVAVDTAAVTLVGVDVVATPNGLTVAVDVASLTLTGQDVAATGSGTATIAVDVASLTLTGVTPTASGSGTVTAAVPPATLTLTGQPVTAASYNVLYPATISGRKLLDQHGAPYLIRSMSSWALASNLSDANITVALEEVVANGFNAVTVWIGGTQDWGAGWHTYTNNAGQNYWTGTPWASTLGAAWASVDQVVSECARLGLVACLSFCGGNGTNGCGDDWEAVSNAQMEAAGTAIATRYLAYPNIVWHIMLDDVQTVASTRGTRIENLFKGINTVEGSSRPVRWMEAGNGHTTDDQGWMASTHFQCAVNCCYLYTNDSTTTQETVYAQLAVPTGDCEPPYVGAPYYTGNEYQQLRERDYAVFFEGGSVINYGHEDWWPFGATGIYTAGIAWTAVQAATPLVQASYAWTLIGSYCADTGWAPTSSFVTTGAGTGDAKAAIGASSTAALAYFPDNRTVVVDTTIIAGTANVRLRWYDPTAGTFSSISASEAQQTGRSVTLPAARGDGTRDFVLVVDAVATVAIDTATLVLTAIDVAATGSGTATATVDVAALTLTGVTPTVAGTGTATVTVDVAALALTGVDVAAVASGTATVVVDPAALALTGIDPAATGSGTATVAVDTAALTLTGVDVSVVTGVNAPIDTATLALTGQDVTATGTGTATVSIDTAALALTGIDMTAVGSGTATVAVDPAALTLTGVDVTATGSGAATTAIDPATLTLTGVDVTATPAGAVVAIDTVILALTGVNITILGTGTAPVAVDPAVLALTGIDVTATGSGTATTAIDPGLLVLTGVNISAAYTGSISPAVTGGLTTVGASGNLVSVGDPGPLTTVRPT